MKRQGGNIVNQPAAKKSDASVSADLRSKIGAKLQTLLNGFTPDTSLFPRNRRQLYNDLFGESHHSQIIIDPTIVIKSEPDEEECSNDASNFNSQNFLLSAKTRITELLNKKQDGANKYPFKDNEKENSLSSNNPTSSLRHNCSSTQIKAKSLLKNSFSRKRKVPPNKDNSSQPELNQVRLKKLVVVVEDIMNSKDGTKFSHLLPTNLTESENCSSDPGCNSDNLPTVSEQSTDSAAKDHASEVSESFVLSTQVECLIDVGSSVIGQLNTGPPLSSDEYNSCENSPQLNASKSVSSEIATTSGTAFQNNSAIIPDLIPFGDILLEESTTQFSNADNSELVDDPHAHQDVLDIASDTVLIERSNAVPEPEVVLLCVKRPTHEVITLEDDNDSEEVIEEVHECDQCGKAFRAKSLLNFHIRMHGNDSSSSNSQPCTE